MNTAEMLERVYQEVGHKDRFYIVSLLNEALSMIVWGSGGVDKTAYLSFIDGQAIAPTDIITPLLLTGDDGPFTLDNISSYNDEMRRGSGNRYAIFDGVIYLFPIQDAEMTLNYFGHVAVLVDDTDVPEIGEQWHYLLPLYASAMTNENKGQGDTRMQRFEMGRGTYGASMVRKRKRTRVREVMDW